MVRKRGFITTIAIFLGVAFICSACGVKKEKAQSTLASEQEQKQISSKPELKPIVVEKKYDLYSNTPYDLPLYSIQEISKLPSVVKESVDKLLDASQGFYLLKVNEDNVLVILQNPVNILETYPRHELQFVEIDMQGKVKYHTAGYVGVDGEIANSIEQKDDLWLFDETVEPHRPLKHTTYDEKGKIKFVESWSYDENESIKYQMKDSHKKVVSILKESQDNDSNYRREHVFYDNDGNIKMSLTVNYEGANISRVTFYNSHDSIDSISIISEYIDGLKVKESIYNESYTLVNTVTSEYQDGERKAIKLFDSEGKELNKISS